jgi:hypothetical protein
MAEVTQQQLLPAPHIEAASKVYLDDLAKGIGSARTVDLTKLYGSQFVAPESALTQQARSLAPGLAGYQPYLQGAQQFQQAAAANTGPQAYQQYMSPYQQSVIDTTLGQYDIQAKKGLPGLAAQAINAGAYGGGREGVQRAEYQNQSDLNRALLQAQLQQQGFGQAQTLAANQYNQQLGLAGQSQGLASQQIAGLSALGQQQQAQAQAQLEAQKQLEYQRIYQPLQTAQQYGSGVMGLISGYPQQTQQTIAPSPSALQTGLGAASTLAGIYKTMFPSPLNVNYNNTNNSDLRLKENISLIGKSPSGLNIYKFKYLNEDNYYQGVMAQEVPHASILGEDGFYKVDYSKVDVEFRKVN